jgi:hypothetical protein
MMRGSGLLFTTIEARSKLFGGIAFFTYASAVCYVMMRFKWRRLSRSQFIYTSVTGGRLWDHRDHVIIRLDLSGLRKTRWYEYAIRFVFGGLTTVATGLIAHHYGTRVARCSSRSRRFFRHLQL